MPVSRRFVLFLAPLLLALGTHTRRVLAATISLGPRSYPLTSLAPYLDTLIPADVTPSASQLGVPQQVAGKAREIPAYLKLLRDGSRWLDYEARRLGARDFGALSPEQRVAVVSGAASSPARSLPKVFFNNTRDDAMFFYYANPASWVTTGFDGPPQPSGYLDHSAPPKAGHSEWR